MVAQQVNDVALRLIAEINTLCKELEHVLLEDSNGDSFPRKGDDHSDLTGYSVKLTTGTPLSRTKGKAGIITRRRGTKYWWITLEDDGREVYRSGSTLMLVAPPDTMAEDD